MLIFLAMLAINAIPSSIPLLSDTDILAANARPQGKDKTLLKTDILGLNRGMRVVANYITAGDVAYPGWAHREIYYDMPPGPACERAGGVTDRRTRVGITVQEVRVCVPAILAQYVSQKDLSRYAVAKEDPSRWVRNDDDYPPAAIRARKEGVVFYELDIDENGRVSACTTTKSSGLTALDDETCKLLQRRGRFLPAIGSTGTAIRSSYKGSHHWALSDLIDQQP